MAEQLILTYRFSCGDLVRYNHGGERFLIEEQRHTHTPCAVDRVEYRLTSLRCDFWAPEAWLTLADTERRRGHAC